MTQIVSILTESDVAKKLALSSIERGEIILFPAETVYGLGVDSRNTAAIENLYILKGRPQEKPFQWLIANIQQARDASSGWSEKAEKLVQKFWPGPLTLVTPTQNGSIGWRIPHHEWLLKLLQKLGRPLIATSANLSGNSPAVTLEAAMQPFKDAIRVAIDGGTIKGGIASTVVAIEKDHVQILREGAIPKETILQIIGEKSFKS